MRDLMLVAPDLRSGSRGKTGDSLAAFLPAVEPDADTADVFAQRGVVDAVADRDIDCVRDRQVVELVGDFQKVIKLEALSGEGEVDV